MLTMTHWAATDKDRLRMNRLIEYTREKGLSAGEQKAERDAVKIEQVEKAQARGDILVAEGYPTLAHYFFVRVTFLNAQ